MNMPVLKSRWRRSASGFTLLEVLISLAITAVLMTAMAALFQQSVTTRSQVDREGQRLENSRFSLDALALDIRLAGFYGPLTIPVSSIDWAYANPCSPSVADWSNVAPIRLPYPIFGYEAHDGNLPAALFTSGAALSCLNVSGQSTYMPGTDVLVIRRVATMLVASADFVAGELHLQVSGCPDDPGKMGWQFSAITAYPSSTTTLHPVSCAAAEFAPVYRVLTRIYFVSSCDDCSGGGDGVPALKVLDVGATNVLRTVAPGVENIHFEYGVDQTTGATAALNANGSVDGYVVSNKNPRTVGATGTSIGGVMQVDDKGTATADDDDDRWDDVVAVKASMLVRDLAESSPSSMSRTFTLGKKDNATPATVLQITTNDRYRHKASSTVVNVENRLARRGS